MVLSYRWTKGFLGPFLVLFCFVGKKQIAPEKMKFYRLVANDQATTSLLTSALSALCCHRAQPTGVSRGGEELGHMRGCGRELAAHRWHLAVVTSSNPKVLK